MRAANGTIRARIRVDASGEVAAFEAGVPGGANVASMKSIAANDGTGYAEIEASANSLGESVTMTASEIGFSTLR